MRPRVHPAVRRIGWLFLLPAIMASAAAPHPEPGISPETPRRRQVVARSALPSLSGMNRGQKVRLPRPGQLPLEAITRHVERRDGKVRSAGGRISGSDRGTFFISEEAGGARGLVLLPDQDLAYALSSLPSGEVLLEEKALTEVMCIDFSRPAGEGPVANADPPNVDPPPSRQSRPNSAAVVYLDMDGEQVTSSSWNGGDLIDAAPSGFSDSKAVAVWERVAEDFRPFDVNVTTDLGVYLRAAENRRIRCIITPSGSWYGGAGGVAYVGSFTWNGDTPCWVFNTGEKSSAEAASHEVGHTLGLSHDGQDPDTEYYGGHGSGDTGWAPIMGVGYSRNLVQWSKGEYQDANRTQDDLQIITSQNGFGYHVDDHGGGRATATPLSVSPSGVVQAAGVIERNTDFDTFILTSRGGAADIQIEPAPRAPNLDVLARIYDPSGTLIHSVNPANELDAEISLVLDPGWYVVEVRGTGKGDPRGTGYSAYGCLGAYTLSGNSIASAPDHLFTVAENEPTPRMIGTLTAVNNPQGDVLGYAITHGDPARAFFVDAAGVLHLSGGTLLDHEAAAGYDLLIQVENAAHPSLSTNLYVRVEVVDVNEPPVLGPDSIQVDLEENPPVDSLVAILAAEDQEGPVTYEILSGNESGALRLSPDTGQIRVADPSVLFGNLHPRLELVVTATDSGIPALSDTGMVQVTLWHDLVSETSPARVRVPASGTEDLVWRRQDFVDVHWVAGTNGVGYDREDTYDSLLTTDVEAGMYGKNRSVYIRFPFTAMGPDAYSGLRLRIKYDDGFVAFLNGGEAARRNASGSPTWNSGASGGHSDSSAREFQDIDITPLLSRVSAGQNVLAIHGLNSGLGSSDALFLPVLQVAYAEASGVLPPDVTAQSASEISDRQAALAAEIRAGGEAPTAVLYWGETDGGTRAVDWAHQVDLGVVTASASHILTGLVPSTTYYFRFAAANSAGEGWADATGSFLTPEPPLTWIRPTAVGRVIVPVDDRDGTDWRTPGFDDSAWPQLRAAVGYERGSGYASLIRSDLESLMYDVNETAYVRISFSLSALPALQSLTLGMKYDDAFVAYLNGQEVARSAHVPAELTWNAGAEDVHDDADAVVEEFFDLTPFTNILVAGTNLLAIHGLNHETTSSDFLLVSSLVAVPAPVLPWTYQRWVDHFGVPAHLSGPEANGDGDRWSNTLEYVFGGDPTQPEGPELAPTIRRVGNRVEYTHRRRIDFQALGILYQVETSSDLPGQSWAEVLLGTGDSSAPLPDGLTEQVTYPIPEAGSATHLRLRIMAPVGP